MKGLIRFVIIVLALAAVTEFGPIWSQTLQDSRAQFTTANPNGDWTYGFINDVGTFVPFNTTFKVDGNVVGWCLDSCPGIMGDITANFSQQAVEDFSARWEPGRLCVNTGIAGKGVVIRWTSPAAASIRIEATFSGQSVSGGKAFIQVLRDKAQLLNDSVDGFTGKSQDREGRKGDSPEASCALETTVTKGSTVDFLVARPEQVDGVEMSAPAHIGVDLTILLPSPDGKLYSSRAIPVGIADEKLDANVGTVLIASAKEAVR